MRPSLPLLFGALCVLWSARIVEANPEAEAKVEADRVFKAGVRAVEDKDYPLALESFRKAYELAPHPIVLINIASAERKLGNNVEALRHYRTVLQDAATLSASRRELVLKEVSELEALVAHLRVESKPDGVEILVDGNVAGRTPLEAALLLEPGPHELVWRLDGHETQSNRAVLEAGERALLSATLVAVQEEEKAVARDRPATVKEPLEIRVAASEQPQARHSGRFAAVCWGTNVLRSTESGAPGLWFGLDLGSRLRLSGMALVGGYAFSPQFGLAILGSSHELQATVAVPMAIDGNNEAFAALAGGLTYAYRPSGLPLYGSLQTLVSYAGERGVAIPTFAGLGASF